MGRGFAGIAVLCLVLPSIAVSAGSPEGEIRPQEVLRRIDEYVATASSPPESPETRFAIAERLRDEARDAVQFLANEEKELRSLGRLPRDTKLVERLTTVLAKKLRLEREIVIARIELARLDRELNQAPKRVPAASPSELENLAGLFRKAGRRLRELLVLAEKYEEEAQRAARAGNGTEALGFARNQAIRRVLEEELVPKSAFSSAVSAAKLAAGVAEGNGTQWPIRQIPDRAKMLAKPDR